VPEERREVADGGRHDPGVPREARDRAVFDVPGVVLTSMVSDYSHFVLSDEPKRTTTPAFFGGLADQIVQQVKGQVRVPDPFDQI